MKYLQTISTLLFLALVSCSNHRPGQSGPLEINSTFASSENCDYLTGDCFIVWWDKNFDYKKQAGELIETMTEIRKECIEKYHMSDPPNVLDGFYYNFYIHNGKDIFTEHGWAAGQGTDSNAYPYETIPEKYARKGDNLLYHEGFHIFQYKANSPGFRYEGDSQWYIEATANWYAATKNPDEKTNYVTGSAVTANPQVPMWYSWGNMEAGDEDNWQRGCHQYGMNVLLNYLTDVRGVDKSIIVEGFFAETELLPQEYLYQKIGRTKMRNLYADWAAHATAGYDYLVEGTEERMEEDLIQYGDKDDVHRFVKIFEDEGTQGQWIRPGRDFVTRSWGYNVYKIRNSSPASYTFHIDGDLSGNEGTPSVFMGRIIVRNEEKIEYFNLDLADLRRGSHTISSAPRESEVFLVIASTPDIFSGNQTFSYQVKIDKVDM